ncbi:hypothetical protein F5884DRAFT_764521 [Xylogone sp. PMI_703]|nr:hypothetical protein F5884DRAFT_764521 [Xylogone sp. PMI_703]
MSVSNPSDLPGQHGQAQPPQPQGPPPIPQPHMVASIFTPFNLAPANAVFPIDRDDKLRAIISNLEKQHDSVRRNMLYLTQLRAERLVNEAKEEIAKLETEAEARDRSQEEKMAEEEAQKRSAQELKSALANMVKTMRIRPKQGSSSSSKGGETEAGIPNASISMPLNSPTSSTSPLTPQSAAPSLFIPEQAPSPVNRKPPVLNTVMSGMNNEMADPRLPSHLVASPTIISPSLESTAPPVLRRTVPTILRDLDFAVRTLIDQSTWDLETYDNHAKNTVEYYRQALERGTGARQGSMQGRRMSSS